MSDQRAGHGMSAGAYISGREDLSEFHYQFDGDGPGGPSVRHGAAWSDSAAWTHCICFGAAARAVEPLLVENDRLRSALDAAREFITAHPAVRGEWPLLVGLIDDALDQETTRG